MKFFTKYKNLLLATLFLGFLLLIHSNHPLDSDEGAILEGAWNMLNGRQLYIDFFQIVTPGSFFVILYAWKIFGVSYLVANTASVVALFLLTIGIYKITTLLIKSTWAYLPPLAYSLMSLSWPLINHNLYNTTCIVWATFFLLRGLDNKKSNYFLLAGFFSGLSILFLQSRGGIFFIGIVLLLLFLWYQERKIYNWKKLITYYISSAISIALFVLLLWPIDVIYKSLIVFPVNNYLLVNRVSLVLFTFFVVWLLFLILVNRKTKELKIKVLLFIQTILLINSLTRPDYYHLSIVCFILLILSSLFFVNIQKQRKYIYYIISAGFIFLILIIPSFLHINYYPFFTINKPIQMIEDIKNNCKESQYIYAGPFLPGVYFESQKLNSGPYYALFTNYNEVYQFEEQVVAIKEKKPVCAILDYSIVNKFNYDIDNPVDNYILQNYEKIDVDSSIYKLK